jgi:hypothetical protein
MVRRLPPFSCKRRVASSPSWRKSSTREKTARGQADPAIKVELDDGPVPIRQHRVARRQVQELPRPRRRQRQRFLARIGGLPRDELRMRRVGNDDRQAQLGRRERQVFIKGRERRDPVVDGFRGGAGGRQGIPLFLDLRHRHLEETGGFLRPEHPFGSDEGKNTVLIRRRPGQSGGW